MPKLPDGQISKHPTKGYRLTLGKYMKDGKPTPRLFWLGHDLERAQYLVFTWKKAWAGLRARGQECWTDENIASVKAFIDYGTDMVQGGISKTQADIKADQQRVADWQQVAAFAVPQAGSAATATDDREESGVWTLEKAVAEYTAHLERKVPHQLSRTNCNRQLASLKCLYEVLPADMAMASIGKEELEKLVARFTARPVREKTGERMAVDTVITTLKHAKAFLDWLDGDRWEAPRRMDKVFRIRRNILLTPAEQRAEANGKDVFNVAELKSLYAQANAQQRLYMLMAINCAFTQKDLATLALDDVQLDSEPPVIDRIRHKTRGVGVRGHWELWTETADLLRKRMASTPKAKAANLDQLALLTEDNQPLVHDDSDADSVALTWRRLVKAVNKDKVVVRELPFKTLRKTASDMILKLSGSEAVQQLMLAHARRSIAGKHYTGETDFAPLVEPLRKLRDLLKAAGMFDVEKDEKKAKAL